MMTLVLNQLNLRWAVFIAACGDIVEGSDRTPPPSPYSRAFNKKDGLSSVKRKPILVLICLTIGDNKTPS
jgi:hypothetical protein